MSTDTEEKLESERASQLDQDASDALLLSATEEPSSDGEPGAGKRTVGLDRWVQLGFVAAAILLVWLYDHMINGIWYIFADPNESVATAGAVVAGMVTAGVLYTNSAAYSLVSGVAEELSKVTWPTRKETSSSTVVVVVTSIVAALMLFLFDSVWSTVTDLVYKV